MGDSNGPVAGRLRRPGWKDPRLLLGVLLIALSVVGVASVVRGADETTAYFAAKEPLAPGTVLAEGDLVLVKVRVGEGVYVAATEEPWGSVVTRTIGAGELLPAAALTDADGFDSRAVAVQTSIPLADGVGAGSVVDVYLTITDESGPSTELVGKGLVVQSVVEDEGSFAAGAGQTVQVVVPVRLIPSFLDAIAQPGSISVVGLAGAQP